jgi:hypothetical protein
MVGDVLQDCSCNAIRPLNQRQPLAVDATNGGGPRTAFRRGQLRQVRPISNFWRVNHGGVEPTPVGSVLCITRGAATGPSGRQLPLFVVWPGRLR